MPGTLVKRTSDGLASAMGNPGQHVVDGLDDGGVARELCALIAQPSLQRDYDDNLIMTARTNWSIVSASGMRLPSWKLGRTIVSLRLPMLPSNARWHWPPPCLSKVAVFCLTTLSEAAARRRPLFMDTACLMPRRVQCSGKIISKMSFSHAPWMNFHGPLLNDRGLPLSALPPKRCRPFRDVRPPSCATLQHSRGASLRPREPVLALVFSDITLLLRLRQTLDKA